MEQVLTDDVLEWGLIAMALVAGLSLGIFLFLAVDRSRRARSLRIAAVALRAAPRSLAAAEAVRLARKRPDAGGLSALLPKRGQLMTRLARAGYKPDPKRYLVASVLTGIGVGTGFFLLGLPISVVLVGTLGAGLLLPHVFLSNRISAREIRFLGNMPEGIDIIVRGLKAGLPVSESLAAVSREAPEPVSGVFREVVDLVRIGNSIDDSIAKAAETMILPELRFLGITIAIQKETGGNLTETLQNLSDILRKRRQMKLKVRAVSSEARASAYIIGSLPFLVGMAIFFTNRSYVMLLFEDTRGVVMVTAGLISVGIGAAVMMKLVKFDM